MSGGHRDDDTHRERENAYKAVHSAKKSWKDSRARFGTFLASFSRSGYGFKKTGSAFNSARHSVISKALYSSSSLSPSLFFFFLLKLLKARLPRHRWFVKVSPLKLQSNPHLSFSNCHAREYKKNAKIFYWLHQVNIIFSIFFLSSVTSFALWCGLPKKDSEISDFLIKIQEDEIIILIMNITMIMQLLIDLYECKLHVTCNAVIITVTFL